MEFLQVGVIGVGAIGLAHVGRLANQISGAKVVAVSDLNQAAAREVAEKYQARFYAEGEDVIKDPNVQAVVVASWDPTHEGYVLAAIKAGKYVLCEKPLAETAESCRRIIDAETAAGRHLVQVGFMRRYDVGYRSMKAALETGEYGAPLMVHCVHRNATSNSQYETKVNVTGAAIHEIDLMRWLLGEEIVAVRNFQPRVSRHVANGQKDPQILMLETKSGIIIDIEVFMHCQYGYDVQCEIVGEDGTLRLPDPAQISVRQKGKCSYNIFADWGPRFEESYKTEFQDWVRNTKKGIVDGPSAWDGYAAIAVSDACLKSRETDGFEEVIMDEMPEFYRTK